MDNTLKKNRVCEVTAEDITTEGAGIGRIDGAVVFVPDLLPGESARVKIIKAAKKYFVARVEERWNTSPARREPPCAVFKRCGGCTLMHMNYESQLELKRNRVQECLARIGGVKTEKLYIEGSEKELCYRGKAALPVREQKGEVCIGGFAARSHEVINTARCMLQPQKADVLIEALREWMKKYGISAYDENRHRGFVRHIVIRVMSDGKAMAAVVINADSVPHEKELADMMILAGADCVLLNINKRRTNVILGENTRTLAGEPRLTERICGVELRISLHTFLQVNHAQCEKLYEKAAEFLEPKPHETIADLYCGAGSITLFLAPKCRKIYGIEVVPQAIEDARYNAELNRADNVSFICADAGKGFSCIAREAELDAIVVDPPRKGLDSDVISQIAACGANRVVYVSCDPATLARDVKLFSEKAFVLRRVAAVDMFPQTTHVETVVLLSKLKSTQHIEVQLNMDELDLTAAESKATYEEIKAYVLEKHGLKVSSLYISQVKRKCGLDVGQNYNLSKKEEVKVPQCPPEKETAIMEALKHFQMI